MSQYKSKWPPPRVFNDWKPLSQQLEEFEDKAPAGSTGYLFRGQADTTWPLRPKLIRLIEHANLSETRALHVEALVLNDYQSRASVHLPPAAIHEGGLLEWWSLMQHHRAPTRALDWTYSPWVAAYFASNSQPKKTGAIWAYNYGLLEQETDPLDGGSVIVRDDQFNAFRAEPGPQKVVRFVPSIQTDRMAAQQSVFTACRNILGDQEEIIHNALTGHTAGLTYVKIEIPPPLKPEVLGRLHLRNIGAASLFPGLDGIGDSTAEFVSFLLSKKSS